MANCSLFFCPGKEAAMVNIVSAAADPLYVLPLWNFDCGMDCCQLNINMRRKSFTVKS